MSAMSRRFKRELDAADRRFRSLLAQENAAMDRGDLDEANRLHPRTMAACDQVRATIARYTSL